MTKEVLQQALAALELIGMKNWSLREDKAITAIKEALAKPEQEHSCDKQEPCDMGNLCIGCSPRNTDGSCPCQKPNGACDCYVDGFNDGMKEMDGMGLYETKQPAQEPVAWMDADGNISDNNDHKCFPIPLYTAPPQRKPLTDEQIRQVMRSLGWTGEGPSDIEFARAIEAAVWEKLK